MIARFGEPELIQLTDRDGAASTIVTAVLERAIDDADAEIDGYLRAAGYDVPLPDPVPPLVSRISADIARYYLYEDQPTDTVRQRYEDQVALLRRIASGDVSLGDSTVDSAGEPATVTSDRVFERECLRDF